MLLRPLVTRAGALGYLALALGLLPLTACSGIRPSAGMDGGQKPGVLMTQDDIVRVGARDALQAIERSRAHLTIQRTGNDHPPRIYRRGVSSFNLSSQVLVVVDGARMNFLESDLRGIPGPSIVYIRILSGREAALEYGSEASNGVILIETAAP